MAFRPRFRVANLAPARLARRLVELLGPTGGATRQSLIALVLNSGTSFVAGVILVELLPTFQRLPGLLVMMTPAIGLGGNVFTTLGNRLSTTIHTGTFTRSLRPRSPLGQNVLAAYSLTIAMSATLAVLASVVSVAVGQATIALSDMLLIALLGGLIGAVPITLLTVLLARAAVRYEWDLDNLVAPVVSTAGDVIIIPAMYLAALMVSPGTMSGLFGWVLIALTVVVVAASVGSSLPDLRQIVRESLPIFTAALILDTLAGMVLQKQIDALAVLPAVFVLLPAFVSTGGALGGILCGRVSTNLHLGSVEPTLVPGIEVRRDVAFLFGLTVPIFVFNALGAVAFAALSGPSSAPGVWWTLAVSLSAAAATMAIVVAVAYYSTIGAWKIQVDPDSSGVPIVSAATDFIGAVAVIVAVSTFALR